MNKQKCLELSPWIGAHSCGLCWPVTMTQQRLEARFLQDHENISPF